MSLDFQHMPSGTKGPPPQIFKSPSSAIETINDVWIRPRGCSMGLIICVGGGAGAGGGFGSTAGASRGGGGGGGSSGFSRLLVPLILLPDRLYLCVGPGGAGVASGTGVSGGLSYVSIAPLLTGNGLSNIVLVSGAAGATGGVTATTGTGGAAGAAGTIALAAGMPLCGYGQVLSIAGQVGSTGGTGNANGTALALPSNSTLASGGTGGGGCTTVDNRGGINTAQTSYIGEHIPSDPVAASPGGSGLQMWRPFFSFGGQGGGSSNTVAGSLGGFGAHGAGGGGGGGGVTTGGKGGDGGGGIIIFVCW